MKFDAAKLTQDLKDAVEAARAWEKANPNDGGSCNFDSCTLRFPRIQVRKVEAAGEAAGCRLYRFSDGAYHLSVPGGGQGFLRTGQAEAQYKLLKERGYHAGMYYRLD